ncbi:SGNH/GDSL hydrolase family protein [Prevotella sp. P6B4]|uniref:SGNH/GDSL hydrolase family protein n=1 Tax=Prevotella sp. P6B4 TaxID=1410614 RepID=UPI0004921727|nr:SGNH/GDSL hydrolase family protein [Prevotella sp. P6B4]
MKKVIILAFVAMMCQQLMAIKTVPVQGSIIRPTDKHIQYTGRISFTNPDRPAFNYPGIQISAAFEGTSLRMLAKPKSGYFMAQIDKAEPFKVAFRGERDSVVTLATALADGVHTVKLMYVIEGYEFYPEFWGFVLDKGKKLVDAPALPSRKIEFIGNSITCGYGNEGLKKEEHFDYATENHYYSYASITARNLDAQHWVVARSGIGAYRNYGEAKSGSPRSCMPVQYEYTGYAYDLKLRQEASFLREKWDFTRYQPDVVCINLGTNDMSTNNYDLRLLKQGYQKLLQLVRQHNPQAKIVFLSGSMLYNKELQQVKQLLDGVVAEARKAGDAEVYRFDMSPISDDAWYGNDWHPNVYQDEKMAGELTAYLRSLMNWF